MKISRNQLFLILGERQPVTPDTAVRLAAAVGGSPRMWLNMQSAYDLWHAEETGRCLRYPFFNGCISRRPRESSEIRKHAVAA